MEVAVDANAQLAFINFHIFPSENRYEAYVCQGNGEEKVASGLLQQLLLHSAEIKSLHSNGSNAKYKLFPPKNSHDLNWFTKSTLMRFLQIIDSANILSLKNEISQLEEARAFHLSLYSKGTGYQLQSGESDDSYSSGTGSTTKADGADASKNELLRAMDLRITALRGELTSAFDQAIGTRYSVEEMTDIERFSQHFGSEDLSDSLRKHVELRQGAEAVEHLSKQLSESERVKSKGGNNNNNINSSKSSSFSETPVKYGVSPAKAAQVERQSSSESDESSFSSEEERPPSVERSRTLIRSASPRRSASPMRRIQIGRSGSRRSTAITIKSLNYYPRSYLPKENDSDEEGSEQAPKKAESNVTRMSVQDAISLFESKQKDQKGDIQKAKSLLNASVGANKAVLRRWSSGVGERSSRDNFAEDSVMENENNVENREVGDSSQELGKDNHIEHCGVEDKLDSLEKGSSSPVAMQEETLPNKSIDASEKLTGSSEWSRQKEAELNELLMKMMETKPVKNRTVAPPNGKRQSLPSEQRGSFYDHYKSKRDEKLRGEAPRERAEKDKQFREMRKILDAKKSELAPAKGSDSSKNNSTKKLQKPQKVVSKPANPKTESPKPAVVKKASPKAASTVPATRKSWPSIPSPRATGPSPAKTPAAISSNPAPARRRSQPTPPVSSSTPKVETVRTRSKPVKADQKDSKKSLRSSTEKTPQSLTKPLKTAKSKVQNQDPPEVIASTAKPSVYSKVTKKSSVVPLESKPFLRKGSKTISNINPTLKKKTSPSTQEHPLRKSEDLTAENPTVSNSSDLEVQQHEDRKMERLRIDMGIEAETNTRSPPKCEEEESFSPVKPENVKVQLELKAEVEAEEESTISPTAWVEIEEQEDHSTTSGDNNCQITDSSAFIAPVDVSSPRIRHSLSQMLLEESNEPDVIDWGNAENPPPLVYHKDAPKGLKRLLKFARKSKTDANSTGWSSPSVFSEGEDDAEDSKFTNKRSTENLLRKATLQSKNKVNQKISTDYEHPAQAAQSLSQHIHEGHVSASATTTKASRSFFSLSAFKGGK